MRTGSRVLCLSLACPAGDGCNLERRGWELQMEGLLDQVIRIKVPRFDEVTRFLNASHGFRIRPAGKTIRSMLPADMLIINHGDLCGQSSTSFGCPEDGSRDVGGCNRVGPFLDCRALSG